MSNNRKRVESSPANGASQQLPPPRPYVARSYTVISTHDVKIYNPKVVSVRKRIISA